MPSLHRELGAKAGRVSANKNEQGILEQDTMEGVSLLAGHCLKACQDQAKPDQWYRQEATFQEGFWEAFMAKAEAIRSS